MWLSEELEIKLNWKKGKIKANLDNQADRRELGQLDVISWHESTLDAVGKSNYITAANRSIIPKNSPAGSII